MKEKILLIALILLTACQTTIQPATNTTSNATFPKVTLTDVLEEFSMIDAELNTSWHKEEIPENMIPPEAIQPWTERLQVLQGAVEKNSAPALLIEARLDVLRSQLAYYLGAEIGEKGALLMEQNGKEFKATNVNCENVQEIAKATKLYYLSFKSWLEFVGHMDELLQNHEAQQKIGTNEKRPAFYKPTFADAQAKIDATVKAVEEQCRLAINLEDTKPSLQHDAAQS